MDCDALQRSLGRPNREQVVTQRGELLTTLQALDLANGQRVSDLLKTGAAKILADQKGQPVDKMIDKLFESALSRLPKPAERDTAREILTDKPTPDTVADLIWVVVMLPEFQLVR